MRIRFVKGVPELTTDLLTAGRAAFERRAWADAYDDLVVADERCELAVDDLERLATAAYLGGRDTASTDAWVRAFRAWIDREEHGEAVRCAFWLALGLIQRGDLAAGGGWLARARHLVEDRRLDCVGCGYLLISQALMALEGGDHEASFGLSEQAGVIAERFADADLATLSRLGRGQAASRNGWSADAAGWFDEAMVAVTTGEVSAVVSGIVYCAVIDVCQKAFDVDRARSWTSALSRWCDDQPSLVPYRGQCLVHRAQILQLHGAWRDALDEARRARDQLSEPPHPAIGMAHYQLGELQRLRGDLADAEASYLRAQDLGRAPQPGLALLRLAEGDVEGAAASIDTAVAGAGDAVERTRQLPAFVVIMLTADRVDRARPAADELTAIAGAARTPYLDAGAAHADGAVTLAEGEPRRALTRLRRAARTWRDLETPYEEAHTHVVIADACRAIGDDETARLETAIARRIFAQLGAVTALARVPHDEESATSGPSATPSGSPHATGGTDSLSAREIQVLRRVARGLTNREVADELFISVKTVERHLSNIFVKLDAPNRAAATAIALAGGVL